jgi:5-methyltetrahydropteroyltriglutamate--homocysteine methyltransferase
VGVIDVRTLEIETPELVAERIRKVLRYLDADRVTITTDCGLKQLPRPVARQKLRALAAGTQMVRRQLAG